MAQNESQRDIDAFQPNYDESKVPHYDLPDPLVWGDGTPVRDAATWRARRRPELLALFNEHVYGPVPPPLAPRSIEVETIDGEALGGRAVLESVRLRFADTPGAPWLDLLVCLPADAVGPVPAFLNLSFYGNHAVLGHPGIPLAHCRLGPEPDLADDRGRAVPESRGARSRRYPLPRIVSRGYALVTACYGDLFPDRPDGFGESIYALFDDAAERRRSGSWGAISAWAWGLSRMADYVEQAPALDARRMVAVGHSRLGKTALWAGANDERFAAVISNACGCGGAALSRRRFGERLVALNRRFPHWLNRRAKAYDEREDDRPVDQHELLALAAPRPLMLNAMTEDLWADPKGMFLSAKHASPVWALLGAEGLGRPAAIPCGGGPLAANEMPAPGRPVLSRVGFCWRPGTHDMLEDDWRVFLDFADRHLPGGPS